MTEAGGLNHVTGHTRLPPRFTGTRALLSGGEPPSWQPVNQPVNTVEIRGDYQAVIVPDGSPPRWRWRDEPGVQRVQDDAKEEETASSPAHLHSALSQAALLLSDWHQFTKLHQCFRSTHSVYFSNIIPNMYKSDSLCLQPHSALINICTNTKLTHQMF